jgi:mono/diheme cytochrome c family protein
MKTVFTVLVIVIALIVFSCGSESSKPAPVPAATSNATETSPPSEGAILFGSRCSSCHGGDGTAGIAGAANLQTSRLDSAVVFQTISNGRNSMPAFADQLSEKERKELTHFVRTLRK